MAKSGNFGNNHIPVWPLLSGLGIEKCHKSCKKVRSGGKKGEKKSKIKKTNFFENKTKIVTDDLLMQGGEGGNKSKPLILDGIPSIT